MSHTANCVININSVVNKATVDNDNDEPLSMNMTPPLSAAVLLTNKLLAI